MSGKNISYDFALCCVLQQPCLARRCNLKLNTVIFHRPTISSFLEVIKLLRDVGRELFLKTRSRLVVRGLGEENACTRKTESKENGVLTETNGDGHTRNHARRRRHTSAGRASETRRGRTHAAHNVVYRFCLLRFGVGGAIGTGTRHRWIVREYGRARKVPWTFRISPITNVLLGILGTGTEKGEKKTFAEFRDFSWLCVTF